MLNILKNRVLREVTVIIIVIVAIVVGIRVALGLEVTESPFYVVSSGSMIPTLNINDVLIVQGTNFNDLKVGDIIVFYKPNTHEKIIVHRIVRIDDINGVRTITTKGDNNPASIPGIDYPITKKDYIGKVVFVIPKLGYITNLIPPPLNYIIVAIIIMLIIINSIGKNKQKVNENIDKQKPDDKADNISDNKT